MPESSQNQPQNNMTMGNTKNVSYPSPWPEMFNGNLQPTDALPTSKWKRIRNVDFNVQYQKNPYAPPTFISKGSISNNAGGSQVMFDKTGGTKLLYVDPNTGSIFINGALNVTTINSGTYSNIVIAGTDTVTGTMINGFYGTPQITGGTFSSGIASGISIQNGTLGTALVQGGTLSSVTDNNATIGTPAMTGGTWTSGVVNAATIGSPSVTNGTMNNGVFGTPAVTGGTVNSIVIGTQSSTGGTLGAASFNGTLTGTITYVANTGTAAIGTNQFAFQTKAGSAMLVMNIGGTNFTWAATGTQ